MIQFLELELTNFAIYPKASFKFATDPERPLTVIRGENESGKTTLMRAFLWVLFGSKGIQEATDNAYALRPVWVRADESVTTKVKLSFRQTKSGKTVTFNLVRTLTSNDARNARLSDDKVVLARQEADGAFKPMSEAAVETLHTIIRPEMRDFYFIDADKAVDFVGGSEANHSDQLMRSMIGKSIRALLSLDTLRSASERVQDQRNQFVRDIAALNRGAIGTNQQQALINVESEIEKLKKQIPTAKAAFTNADETHRLSDEQFSTMIKELEMASKRAVDGKKFRDNRDQLNVRRRQLVHQLAEHAPGAALAAAILSPTLKAIIDRLEPMKEKGHIPPHELEVIPRLIQRGVCLCGTEISEGSPAAEKLTAILLEARKTESGARFLDGVLNLATRHKLFGAKAVRNDPITAIKKELADLDPQISELSAAITEVERTAAAEGGKQAEASEMKRDIGEKLAQRDTFRDALTRLQNELEKLETERRSHQESIRLAAGRSDKVKVLQASERAADLVKSVVQAAYERVESDQVADVSKSMTNLFSTIIGQTEDGLISEVGLRTTGPASNLPEYELFARYQNADKPLKLINGASRRALSVAFVLALAEQTGTRVPLVTDSLLHSTSGEVRKRLVDFLAKGKRIGQPIMFGTRADFQSPEVRTVLDQCAGATYTLTAQSHVGADVVRADPNREQSNQVSICNCSPRQYCAICERTGDASTTDLSSKSRGS
jgi:DNA sulfur modification protein DndD